MTLASQSAPLNTPSDFTEPQKKPRTSKRASAMSPDDAPESKRQCRGLGKASYENISTWQVTQSQCTDVPVALELCKGRFKNVQDQAICSDRTAVTSYTHKNHRGKENRKNRKKPGVSSRPFFSLPSDVCVPAACDGTCPHSRALEKEVSQLKAELALYRNVERS